MELVMLILLVKTLSVALHMRTNSELLSIATKQKEEAIM